MLYKCVAMGGVGRVVEYKPPRPHTCESIIHPVSNRRHCIMTKTATRVKRRRSIQRSAIREIKKYQDKGKYAVKNLVPKSCFNRLARDIARNQYFKEFRFREDAMNSLQEAAESYITNLLKNANKIAVAQGRMTLQSIDMQLANSILTNTDIDFALPDTVTSKNTGTVIVKQNSESEDNAAEEDDDDDFDEDDEDADEDADDDDDFVVV